LKRVDLAKGMGYFLAIRTLLVIWLSCCSGSR